MGEIYRPHSCAHDYLEQPDRPGIIVRCDCGRLWRSVHPGNPAYAGWRRIGPVYRLLFGNRLAAQLRDT
jgi:hypothetical protein